MIALMAPPMIGIKAPLFSADYWAMVESYGRHFVLPQQPKPEVILHHAIRMLEGLWELSYQQHGLVTDDMSIETDRAMTAYLSLYWPKYLPLK